MPARLAAAVLLLLAPAARGQVGRAPDGKPGFGTTATLHDARELFRSPGEEERAFLAALQALENDVRVLMARFAAHYVEAGYDDLLEPRQEPTLEHLHAAWFELREEPLAALLSKDHGRVFARVCADVRFRVRARLLVGVEDEFRELDGALDLMRAHFDGYADLSDAEVAHLGVRADIAAARLRALRLDLDALRDDAPLDEQALAAFAELGEAGPRGREALERTKAELQRLDALEQRMIGVLFTAQPSEELLTALDWRDRMRAGGQQVLEQVRVLSPLITSERDAPPEVARLSKSKRHEYAARTALEGLSLDLLNPELYYLAGESSDFQWGPLESRRWFDRYLALRGIRAHDHRSYDPKTLDERDRRAIERVQAQLLMPR